MIQRSPAVADARGVRDGPGDIPLGEPGGLQQFATEREVRGKRRRKRAAGPVRVARVDARRATFVERVAIEHEVDDLRRQVLAADRRLAAVTSRDDYGGRTHVVQPPRGLPRIVHRCDAQAAERLRFGNIGGDDARTRNQLRAQRLHAVGVEQPLAARRDEHRVDHDNRQLQRLDRGRHRLDNGPRREHADLGGVDREVAGDRFDLCGHKIGRQRRHRLDPLGALHGDGRDRAGAVHAECRERLQVGLDAGAATRVAARNCQGCTHTLRSAIMYPTFIEAMTTRADARFRIAEQIGAVLFVTILTAMAAQISVPLPFTPVPFTFQPMVVLIGAAALGARLGAARLLGPTGGYLMSYPLAAFVAGALAERGFDRRYLTAVLAMACGLAVIFAGGVLWLTIAGQPSYGLS